MSDVKNPADELEREEMPAGDAAEAAEEADHGTSRSCAG